MRYLIICLSIFTFTLLNVGTSDAQVQIGYGEFPHTWSLDLETFVMGTKNSIRIYRIDRNTPIVVSNQDDVRSLVLHPTQDLLASTDRSGSVRLWDTRTGALLNEWSSRDHNGRALFMEFDIDYPRLWILFSRPSGDVSTTYVKHWNYTLKSTHYYEYEISSYEAVCCFNMQRGFVATYTQAVSTGGYGYTGLTPRHLFTAVELQRTGVPNINYQFIPTPSSPYIYGLRINWGIVFVVNFLTGETMSPTTPPNIIEVIGLSDDGQFLLTSGNDRKLRQWNITTKELIAIYPNQPINIDALRMTEQGQILAFSVSTREVKVIDAQTLETLVEFVINERYSELDQ